MSLARFGVNKPVPVNLLMAALIIGGLGFGLNLRKEFFPESDPTQVLVTLPYPGASPEEIEETMAIKVEDAIANLDEVKDIFTTLSEGGGGITIELREGIDPQEGLDEIERAIDALQDLPDESEDIRVELFEPRLPVIRVAVFGDLEERVLKQAIRSLEDDLSGLPGMGEILLEGVRDDEVRIDVDLEATLRMGISLPEIARRVSDEMREVPGGTVRTNWGNVKLRTLGVEENAPAIRDIKITTTAEGDAIRLGDIAEIHDDFVDTQLINRFNGKPAANLTVFKVGDQDIVKIAEMTRAYVAGRQGHEFPGSVLDVKFERPVYQAYRLGLETDRPLPVGAEVALNTDLARFVEGRLDLLLRNAGMGAALVFGVLLLFLNVRVAVWVGAGLVTALSGTIMLMYFTGITLNLLTMFGLIVVLGLLVDDAIVVAENIQSRHDRGEPALAAAVRGTDQVSWPVVATVLTSIVAFLPLTFVRGRIGDLLGALPMVVACALIMSLIESLLILPSHMGHTLMKRDKQRAKPKVGRLTRLANRWESLRDHVLYQRVVPVYGQVMRLAMNRRYTTLLLFIAALIVSFALVQGGRQRVVFLPKQDSETIIIDVRMPLGTPIDKTNAVIDVIEAAAEAQPEVKSIGTQIGQSSNIDTGQAEASAPHVAQMFIELVFVEERDRESRQIINSIRDQLEGQLTEVERISFDEISGGPAGKDITIEITGTDSLALEGAADEVKKELGKFAGVFDIADDNSLGQLELQVQLKPWARAQGFTKSDVALQLRGYLFGIDAHVFADRREDIDVRVRVDERTRRNLNAIEETWIVSPDGTPVPLSQVATLVEDDAYATIRRTNRERSITIVADTTPIITPNEVVGALTQRGDPDKGESPLSILQSIEAEYPGVRIDFAGAQQQQRDAFASLPVGFAAAVIMIYVILAWLFSSYTQPIIVLMAVPFSLVGVIWGHYLLGFDMTFLSNIGFVALAGIVVNDSLILVKFYNGMRERGMSAFDALLSAGRARFRAIFLTTVTTVFGLLPLILEQSFQAKFLIPMGIAIAGGLVSATVLVLLLLPCLILIFEDLKDGVHWLWTGEPRPKPELNADDVESFDDVETALAQEP